MSGGSGAYGEVKQAALDALGQYAGVADPEQPWWNLNMPKALDIMLPAVLQQVSELLRQEQYRVEAKSHDFGPAVHPDFGPDWIVEYATPASSDLQDRA